MKKNILRDLCYSEKNKSNVFNSSKACLWLSFVLFIQMFTEHFLCARHYLFLIERILYMLTEEMLYILEAKEDVTTYSPKQPSVVKCKQVYYYRVS